MEGNSPIYLRISKVIRERIEKKKYIDTLPSEQKIMEEFKSSRSTVRKAINLLVEDGLLERKRGSGTYIKDLKIEKNIVEVQSFKDEMLRNNLTYENKVINFEVVNCPKEIAPKLGLKVGDLVYYIKRVTVVKDTPVVLETSYMPVKLFKDLSYDDLTNSKYEYVQKKKGLKILGNKQEIIPIAIDSEDGELLEAKSGEPTLKVCSIGYIEGEKPFDYAELIYKTGLYKLTLFKRRS